MTADRHAFRPSLFLLLIALSTLLAGVAACTPRDSPPVGETGGEASGEVEAMAGEHQGDRPEASEAATTEPAVEVIGNPVIYADVAGRDVTGYLARPADAEGPLPGLLVIHEWWGLNDNIRAVTRRLAGEGYVALAVDLYGGQSAETPDRARQLMEAVDQSEALENLRQARQHLAERLTATGDLNDRIGVIGWCFGGGWSLRTALAMPNQIAATVVYYGYVPTEPEELEPLTAPLLGLFGAEDGGIPPERVHAFESALGELGKTAEIHIYDGAGHAFANPSGRNYQPEAATDAWRRTVDFLSQTLRPKSES